MQVHFTDASSRVLLPSVSNFSSPNLALLNVQKAWNWESLVNFRHWKPTNQFTLPIRCLLLFLFIDTRLIQGDVIEFCFWGEGRSHSEIPKFTLFTECCCFWLYTIDVHLNCMTNLSLPTNNTECTGCHVHSVYYGERNWRNRFGFLKSFLLFLVHLFMDLAYQGQPLFTSHEYVY